MGVSAFRVLGPVEAWTDERRLVLGGPQQVKLLAFLLLNANRALSADAVIDAVWGAGRQGAAKRMQMGVSRLRRGLEPLNNPDGPRLRTVSGGYFLSVAPGELDADVFVAQVQDGRAALDAGDPVRARDLLGSALGLWRGAPLAEVAFEDFAQAEIRRLEELRLEALEARIDADLRLRSHARVVGELQALLPEHPTRERLASQLMLALYRCGRQADALEVYQRTRAQLAEELGLEPGPALRTLQMQILAQAPSLKPALDGEINGSPRTDPEPGPSGHVPRSPTPLIAREQELETVCRLLQDADVRLVTLTGTGGVGKTRLALAIAHRLESSFPDGVCWVELAGVSGPQDVGSTVTRALSLTPLPGESATDALGRHLASKRLLLVIDNFEHVLEAAILVAELHRSTAEVVLLITSREALNLAGEHQFLVAPLAVPVSSKTVTVAELETSAASALFLAAARRRNGRFAISPTAAPAVAEICARLDGLPLALELAAARTTVLSITELMTRLKDAVTDLGAAPRDAPVRQRTLHATLEWSYQMLDEALQRAFVRFAVFAGGATLDAACGVTGAALEVLDALIAKSLIDRRQQPDGGTRLVMLETVRHYAQQRLAHDPERDVVSLRHLEYYLQIAERADGKLDTHDEAEALQLLDGEIDNIGAALRWGQGRDPDSALRLAGQIGGYWLIRGDGEALVWLDQALQAAGEQASPAKTARECSCAARKCCSRASNTRRRAARASRRS